MTTSCPIYKFISKHASKKDKKHRGYHNKNDIKTIQSLKQENDYLFKLLEYDIDLDHIQKLFEDLFVNTYSEKDAIRLFIKIRNSDNYVKLRKIRKMEDDIDIALYGVNNE